MSRTRKRLLAAAAVIVALAGVLVGLYSTRSNGSEQAFVTAMSKRLCAVERHVFPSQSSLLNAYNSALRNTGLSAAQWHSYTAELNTNAHLAAEVTQEFRSTCLLNANTKSSSTSKG